MLLNHLDWKMILLGIGLGLIAKLVVIPEKRVITKYPTPDKCDSLVYSDNNGTCFKFSATEVSCSASEENLADFPLDN
jgi:hypothetical protein